MRGPNEIMNVHQNLIGFFFFSFIISSLQCDAGQYRAIQWWPGRDDSAALLCFTVGAGSAGRNELGGRLKMFG